MSDVRTILIEKLRSRGFASPVTATNDILSALAEAGYVVVPKEPTLGMLNDACMTYRHDYGLLSVEERSRLMETCRHWWLGIIRAAHHDERT